MVFKPVSLFPDASAAWAEGGGSLVRVGSELRRGLARPGSSPASSAVSSGAPAVPSGTAYVTSAMPAISYALKQSLDCLLALFFFSFLLLFPSLSFPCLSAGLHHLPAFHSLGSREKELNKSTCCFYQVNLCEVAWSEEIYILSI